MDENKAYWAKRILAIFEGTSQIESSILIFVP